MNGSAPNCSAIGPTLQVKSNSNPNLCAGSADPCHNSKISNSVTSTTEAANKNVISRAISSPSRSRLKNEREPAMGPALGTVVVAAIACLERWLLNLGQRDLLFSDHFFRQLRVRQLLSVVLPVREHPFHESINRITFRRVREFIGNQQPRKARDRIRGLARRVGDLNSEIVRRRFSPTGSTRADAG